MTTNSIALDLDAPGTLIFTAEHAIAGHRLNACALSLRSPAARAAFNADPAAYMRAQGLSPAEIALVETRHWTGLLHAGGHLQAITFFAATVGETLFDVGAHNAGMTTAELMQLCPRQVSGLPRSLAPPR